MKLPAFCLTCRSKLAGRPFVVVSGVSFLFLFLIFTLRPAHAFLFPLIVGALPLLPLLLFPIFRRKRAWRARLPVFLALGLLPVLLLTSASLVLARRERILASYNNREVDVTFAICALTPRGSAWEVEARALQAAGEKADFSFTFYLFSDEGYRPGECATCRFLFTDANPAASPAQSYALSQGRFLQAEANEELRESNAVFPFFLRPTLWKNALKESLTNRMDDTGAAFCAALLFADKSSLSGEVREDFAALGLSHLLAVSGLHLSILLGALSLLCERFGLSMRLRVLFLSLVMTGYLFLTGFALSLLRAGGMLLLFYLSLFVRRRRDTLTALFAAVFLILLFSPEAILDPALLLSFASTAGILALADPILRRPKNIRRPARPRPALLTALGRRIREGAVVTLSATAFSLPILWLFEKKLFLFSVVSNLLFVPLFTLLLFLLLLFCLTAPLPFFGDAAAWAFTFVSIAVEKLAAWLRPLSFANLSLRYAFMPFLLLALVLALALLLLFGQVKRRPGLLLLPMLVFLLAAPCGVLISDAFLSRRASIFAYGDGSHDALIFTEGKSALAVSVSTSASFTEGIFDELETLDPSLHLEALVLTGGNISVVTRFADWAEAGLRVLFYPGNRSNSRDIAAAASRAGLTVCLFTPGDSLTFGSLFLTTFPDNATDKGADTAAFAIRHAGKDLLYLRRDAPEDFDIRFGPMRALAPTLVVYGGAGGSPAHTPIVLPYPNAALWVLALPDPLHHAPDDVFQTMRCLYTAPRDQ